MNIFPLAVGAAFLIALLLFFLRLITLYRYLRLGTKAGHFTHPVRRFGYMVYFIFSQACSRSHKNYYPGTTHFTFFWGFLLLFPSIVSLILGPLTGFTWMFIGPTAYNALFLIEDVLVVVVLVSVAFALYRRLVIKPAGLESTFDSYFILLLVIILMVSLMFHNALEVVLGTSTALYLPVSHAVAAFIISLHPSVSTEVYFFYGFYWTHVLTILFFLVYIPYSKHLHLLAAFPNIFLKPERPRGELSYVDIDKSEKIGAKDIRDFSWKDYLDGMACTECCRCTMNCPASNTGKLLNPRTIISKVKHSLYHNAPVILRGGTDTVPVIAPADGTQNDYTITEEEIWACTTCGACLEQCPVSNDHPGKIIQMRRYQVMMEGSMPKEIEAASTSIERNGNPWGFPSIKRDAVAKEKNVKTLKEAPAEYLFFFGCAGSYDPTYRKSIEATIDILQKAGINFGTLGNEESCCGDLARRNGNEYLFQTQAKKNIEMFKKYGVEKIIFSCPHCYNTVKNEYPQLDGKFETYHHTEILERLVREGKIRMRDTSDGALSTYHDPCYLGRYNSIYEQPRRTISPILNLKEMKKSREGSFCCGGGSGKFLTDESKGERVNVTRTRQALELNVKQIVTACPYCKIMIDDGLKHEKREDVKVADISEVVLASMG